MELKLILNLKNRIVRSFFIFILSIFLLLLPLVGNVSADSVPDVGWEQIFDTGRDDGFKSHAICPDGSYIFAGSTLFESKSMGWVVKVNSIGEEQWRKTFDRTGNNGFNSVAVSSDGSYILVGDITLQNEVDGFVVKLDVNGNVQWEKTLDGGGYYETFNSVDISPDGGYIIAGRSLSNYDSYEGWIVKLSSSGVEQWSKTLPGTLDYDYLYSVVSVPDGGYILAGSQEMDAWALKLNADGQEQWSEIIDFGSQNEFFDVTLSADGGYVFTGWKQIPIIGDSGSQGVVVKFNADGQEQWSRTYIGLHYDALISIDSSNDGGFITSGIACPAINEDCYGWVMKVNSEGVEQWSEIRDTVSRFSSVVACNGNCYILAGVSENSISTDNDGLVVMLGATASQIETPSLTLLITFLVVGLIVFVLTRK